MCLQQDFEASGLTHIFKYHHVGLDGNFVSLEGQCRSYSVHLDRGSFLRPGIERLSTTFFGCTKDRLH
jgi:hypothetical protein